MDTPDSAATIKAWAEHANVTHGTIMRTVVELGLTNTIRSLRTECGELPQEIYDRHLAQEVARGEARAAAGAAVKRESRLAKKTRKPARKARATRAA